MCEHRILPVCASRILNKMAAKKKSTNLTLSPEHKRRLVVLKTRLTRNSQTNVVEHLIDEKWNALDKDALQIHTRFQQ